MSNYTWVVSAGGTKTGGGGVNNNTITITWTTAGAQTVRVSYTNAFGCTTASPTIYPVTVSNFLPVSVAIAASSNPVCAGTSVTYTATPTNGGSAPAFQWKVDGVNQGTNSPTYTYTPINGNIISCVLTSNLTCATGNPATSNSISMTVNPLLPVSVSIAASANPVCAGTSVTYTATPTNAGSTPSYQWKVNGVNQGTNSPAYTFTPINGQTVTCVLTSDATCATGNPATSNPITMTVNLILPVSVSIAASANPVCAGVSVTFTATPTNGGSAPSYQWKVNGVNQGANTPTYTFTPTNGQTIICVLTSNAGCTTGSPANSNSITMTVNPIPVPTITGPTPVCVNSTGNVYATESGMTNYMWSVSSGGTTTAGGGTTNNTVTVTWTTAGTQTVSVNYTHSNGCINASPTVVNITVNSQPSITVQPSDVTVNAGLNTSFSVTATGTGLTYQWQVNTGSGWNDVSNGGVYSGATTNTLTITGVTSGMNGYQYRCIVSGTCSPPATSNGAILTVNSPPVITCPSDIIKTTDPGLCSAVLDPGFPTRVFGSEPITYIWVMTGATTGSGSGAIVPNPHTFNAGITTITWRATNIEGFDECTQTITIVDNQAPEFIAPLPLSFCVEVLYTAAYWDPTMDIMPDRPEYYLFKAGDTILDLNPATFTDNCPLSCISEIRWRISFFDGTFLPALPSLYITGQPSDYPTDIQLPGSVTGDVVHTITFQIVDCNGNVSLPVTINITIKPRPNIIKQ
jgi:hypothetical protein